MKFIELHLKNDEKITVNVDSIEIIGENFIRTVGMETNITYPTIETYDEIKNLIESI